MDELQSVAFWVSVLAAAVRAGTPLLFTTLGEIICERSGVLNLGLEGMMLVGALGGVIGTFYTENVWLGFLIACLAGGALSLLHAYLCITLRSDQVISGIMVVFLGTGLTNFFGTNFFGQTMVGRPLKDRFATLDVLGLSHVPVVGKILFYHDPLVYVALGLVPVVWWFLFKTRLGLAITAAGENPAAADALGVNVGRVRYLCVFLGGLLAGAGGGYISLVMLKSWQALLTSGRGWIAVALVIFSLWKPQRAIFGAYLFGGIEGLQLRMQAAGIQVSYHLLQMLPYLSTIVVLLFVTAGKARQRLGAPSALTQPYERTKGG